jgi:flagellar hook-associated protein 2
MANVTSLGAGSGLDLEGLVTSLMSVEKRPLTLLKKQVDTYNTKISSLGKLSSKLGALQTAAKNLQPDVLQSALDKFAKYGASLSKTASGGEIGTVTADKGAVSGNYSIDVGKLAQAQKITSAPGALDNIEPGTLTIAFKDGETTDIEIAEGNNTAEGLRNAINQARIGISATIVNGANGPQLTLTGEDGAEKAFSLSGIAGLEYDPDLEVDPESDPPASNFTSAQVAQDAEFTIDGIAVRSSSNKVTEAIEGITLNLTGEGKATLSVTQDNSSKLKESLEAFVTAYNDAVGTMASMSSYNTDTKVAGELQGNTILRNAQQTLSRLVFNTTAETDGLSQRLGDIGISFKGSDGKLALDADKLAAAIDRNPAAVANLASSVGSAFNKGMDNIVGLGGQIQTSTEGMRMTVKSLETRQEALTMRLETIENRYRSQFSALDSLMYQMNTTSSYLAQNLSRLAQS